MTKTPTLKEKVEMYEGLLHDIQLYREVTMDAESVRKLLDNIGNWSYAHRQGNGELSDTEQQELVDSRFWNLRKTK